MQSRRRRLHCSGLTKVDQVAQGAPSSAPVLVVAGWIGIVSAAGGAVCAVCSGTDRSSTDAYGHPTAYGCTTVNATTVNASVADAAVINASTTNTSTTATAVRKGVS